MSGFLFCVAAAYSAFCALEVHGSWVVEVHFVFRQGIVCVNVDKSEAGLLFSVSFAVLVWSVAVFGKFLFEHVVHVYGGAGEAACV